MNYYFLLLIPLSIAGFIGFWCLVVKLVSLMGWQRMAQYQTAIAPTGTLFAVSGASVGGVRYRGALQASASAAGLYLVTGFPFRIGHPPLLIPWSAIGPFLAEKTLWMMSYTTTIQTSSTGTLTLSFMDEDLIKAARPWITTT